MGKTHYEAVVKALVLAVTADSEEQAKQATGLAEMLAVHLTENQIQAAKEDAAERLEIQEHVLFVKDILINNLKELFENIYSNAQSLDAATKSTLAIQTAINDARINHN